MVILYIYIFFYILVGNVIELTSVYKEQIKLFKLASIVCIFSGFFTSAVVLLVQCLAVGQLKQDDDAVKGKRKKNQLLNIFYLKCI